MISDEELMQQVQHESHVAYTVLVKRYQPRLYKFVFRYTRNHQDAEDIIQETFLRVYRGRSGYRRIARFSTWLYTIALNLAKSHYRKNSKMVMMSIHSREDEEEQEVPELSDQHFYPDELTDNTLMMSRLYRAIDMLPEEFREVILMRDLYELTYDEIESITGLPMGTVKSRISRGRSRLQDIMRNYAPSGKIAV